MFSITLTGDREVVARFAAMPDKLRQALLKKIYELALKLENKVKTDKLSGQVLNHKTGNLWRSIQNSVESSGDGVTGKVYSAGDVKYAAIHEFGGDIPPHVIEPKNGEALAFMLGGKEVFLKKVNWPGADMPERSFMRSSLADMKEDIIEGYREAVNESIHE